MALKTEEYKLYLNLIIKKSKGDKIYFQLL